MPETDKPETKLHAAFERKWWIPYHFSLSGNGPSERLVLTDHSQNPPVDMVIERKEAELLGMMLQRFGTSGELPPEEAKYSV